MCGNVCGKGGHHGCDDFVGRFSWAELKLTSNWQVVCLCYPDGDEHQVGISALRRIVVHGDAAVSTAVIRAAEAGEVSMIFLPGQSKGNAVNLFPHEESHFKYLFCVDRPLSKVAH